MIGILIVVICVWCLVRNSALAYARELIQRNENILLLINAKIVSVYGNDVEIITNETITAVKELYPLVYEECKELICEYVENRVVM